MFQGWQNVLLIAETNDLYPWINLNKFDRVDANICTIYRLPVDSIWWGIWRIIEPPSSHHPLDTGMHAIGTWAGYYVLYIRYVRAISPSFPIISLTVHQSTGKHICQHQGCTSMCHDDLWLSVRSFRAQRQLISCIFL